MSWEKTKERQWHLQGITGLLVPNVYVFLPHIGKKAYPSSISFSRIVCVVLIDKSLREDKDVYRTCALSASKLKMYVWVKLFPLSLHQTSLLHSRLYSVLTKPYLHSVQKRSVPPTWRSLSNAWRWVFPATIPIESPTLRSYMHKVTSKQPTF